MKTPTKIFALAITSFGLSAIAAPAIAGSSDKPTRIVSAAGLDLASPQGQSVLDHRIENAAREVCNYRRMRTGTRTPDLQARQCLDQAAQNARNQVATIIGNQERGG